MAFCTSCGTALAGPFCSKCGVPAVDLSEVKTRSVRVELSTTSSAAPKQKRILNGALFLAILICLAIIIWFACISVGYNILALVGEGVLLHFIISPVVAIATSIPLFLFMRWTARSRHFRGKGASAKWFLATPFILPALLSLAALAITAIAVNFPPMQTMSAERLIDALYLSAVYLIVLVNAFVWITKGQRISGKVATDDAQTQTLKLSNSRVIALMAIESTLILAGLTAVVFYKALDSTPIRPIFVYGFLGLLGRGAQALLQPRKQPAQEQYISQNGW